MTAVVTGGAGFIGSHLAEELMRQGWNVTIVDNFCTGSAANIPSGAKLLTGDACEPSVLKEAMAQADTVFHLAAVSSVLHAVERPLDVHRVNLTMTLAMLEAACAFRIRRFIFASSAAIYGDINSDIAREDLAPQPLSHYAVQKLACEHYCHVYRRIHELETVCLRYFNVYGTRQRSDSTYSGVISRFLDACQQGRATTVVGDGSQTRDFVHSSDVVRANMLAATAPAEAVAGRVFNVGTGKSVSINGVAHLMRGIFSGLPAPTYTDARAGEIRHSCACTSLAKSALGFTAAIEFSEGLQHLAKSHSQDNLRQ
jgi:nucleoside-diphosphate-sugar epimerase